MNKSSLDNELKEPFKDLVWNSQLEKYFVKTGEQAQCLSILHGKCEELYSKRKVYIDLPVFIGSGIIAFLNAASSNIFEGQSQMSSIALGVGSLTVGILNTIGSYFGWSKRAEGHRISQIQYSRLYRFLSVELTLHRDQRMSPKDLLKYSRDAYDRLLEIGPSINADIMKEFALQFQKNTISKPEGANGLESIMVFQEYQSTERKSIGAQTETATPLTEPREKKLDTTIYLDALKIEKASDMVYSMGED